MSDIVTRNGIKHKKIMIRVAGSLMGIYLLLFCGIAVGHHLVFSRADYDEYARDRLLVYEDISKELPRETWRVCSGDHYLSAYLYGEVNEKGTIVIAPGHRDPNDVKLYEVGYFVNAGYSVVGFDYTGCYTSEGKNMVGYNQSVHDLDAVLTQIENDERFAHKPIFLFGHSMGGYAVAAELQFKHQIKGAVVASGFDTPEEQWQYSIKRYTGFLYPILKPLNTIYIKLKYGKERHLSAIKGINSVESPILVLSAEDDIFYGGKSPIYEKRDEITNPHCTMLLMDQENHNGHYDYFLTDRAIAYQDSKPAMPIDKKLYMEHDEKIMRKICDFYDAC